MFRAGTKDSERGVDRGGTSVGRRDRKEPVVYSMLVWPYPAPGPHSLSCFLIKLHFFQKALFVAAGISVLYARVCLGIRVQQLEWDQRCQGPMCLWWEELEILEDVCALCAGT